MAKKTSRRVTFMEEIKFVHLFEVKEELIIHLMNNEMVGKQLPMLVEGFSAENCRVFLKAKKRLWDEHGFGPWAILIKGEFAGWGDYNWNRGKPISPYQTSALKSFTFS